MELRYCDGCGNPIRVDLGQPFSLTDRCLCEACRGGQAGKEAGRTTAPASAPAVGFLDSSNLNLYSTQTIVVHKQKHAGNSAPVEKPKSSKLKLVKPGSTRVASAPGTSLPAAPLSIPTSVRVAGTGSTQPASSAQKIVFRCIHCKVTLSIRPVDRTSKLTCPHCTKEIYITISGRALKMSPSVRVPGEAGAPRTAGEAGHMATTPLSVNSPSVRGTGSQRVPLVPPLTPAEPLAESRAETAGKGSAVVVKPGSVRVVKSVSSRVLKASTTCSPGGSTRLDLRGAKTQAPASQRGPAVRIAAAPVKPSTASSRQSSAFAEHQARTDAEKTLFITDEATTDLSAMASAADFSISGHDPRAQKGAGSVRPQLETDPLRADASDLLENDGGAATPKPAATGVTSPSRKNIAQRVLKSLF